jgi:hypothetical protein
LFSVPQAPIIAKWAVHKLPLKPADVDAKWDAIEKKGEDSTEVFCACVFIAA